MTCTGIRRRSILRASLGAAALHSLNVRAAETFPRNKPITIVVPFPPGGSNDLIARLLSKSLGETLKQSVVVENRAGAAGNIGAQAVSNAEPDGHTVLLFSSTFISNAAIQPKLPYDPISGFKPVSLLARSPLIVVVNNEFPARTPRELIDVIRKNPGKFNYASSGSGSLSHFCTELLKEQGGNLEVTHVPYKGTGPALNDLIGGQTQVYIASAPVLLPMVRTNKVRGIAVTSQERSPVVNDLPPLSEALPGFEYLTWWAVAAPSGTPDAVVKQINIAINAALADPAVKSGLMKEGAEATPGDPSLLSKLMPTELERMKTLAKQRGIRPD